MGPTAKHLQDVQRKAMQSGHFSLNEEQVRKRLQAAIDKAGSQRAWAKAHGLSAPFVNDVLRGNRQISDRICDALGLERIVTYRIIFAGRD